MKKTFTRIGLFLAIYFLILTVPFGIGYYRGFDIFSSLYLLIMAGIGPFIYRYLQKKADALLLADQKKYQDFLHLTARNIATIHDLNKLLNTVVKIIFEAVNIEYAAIFIIDKENSVYKLKKALGNFPFPVDYDINNNEEIIKAIKKNERPFSPDTNKNHFAIQKNLNTVKLVIPINFNSKLLGFLFLGNKINNSAYTKRDINAFDILAVQSGLAIENCIILNENKKFQERIFQTEKSSLLGGMAEGIAHTIKNRLQYFSIAASVLKVEADSFISNYKDLLQKYPDINESVKNIIETHDGMLTNIKKTDEIIHSVIKYSRIEYDQNSFSEFPLKELITIASNMVKIRHNVDDISLIIEIKETVPIFGIMSQILESVYNLLDNSYEAIEEKKRYYKNKNIDSKFDPVIIVTQTETQSSYIIKAYDNGIGIQQENINKIFAPYFTTKSSYKTKSKPGIGMFVMARIIEEIHSGKIWFESEYMAGTTFYIELPKKRKSLTA